MICATDGCERDALTRGWCSAHYERWLDGRPMDIPVRRHRRDPVGRRDWITAAINSDTDDCIEWPEEWGRVDDYGRVKWGGKMMGVHQVVCAAAHGPRPDGMEVAHSCGNPPCGNSRHLRWDTRQGNADDMVRHGTRLKGERNHRTKLTEADVVTIRGLVTAGFPRGQIADAFGVDRKSIYNIVHYVTWA